MNRIKIEVPEGIRFLNDWKEFNLNRFSPKCIINKQIPGCGFTEYCIRSNENIILCSPRKILLYNKWDQHQSEVYLVRNEMDKDPGIDKDISKDQKNIDEADKNVQDKEKNSLIYDRLNKEIREYVYYCINNNIPSKILVTYDSYRIVQQILIDMGLFDKFYTVIDEFQSILHDARFKSDTEMKFMNYLKKSHSVLFVSATPMMDEYLSMLSEFNTLPYYELDWYTKDPTRVIKPSLKVLTMKSVGTKAEEIINKYLNKDFDDIVVIKSGIPTRVISDEAVLYVNSVNHIISIIKKCGLAPDQVNILCADTEENKKKIKRKLGRDFSIGKVPKEGEPHKMFTFCTRTVYLGADFYSTCAQSFIFSDSNSDCLAVDIEEDLPQILGRQRLFENPWKNTATFYYRYTADYKKMNGEQLQEIIQRKKKATEDLINIYKDTKDNSSRITLANTYQILAKTRNYKDNYVAVNKIINDQTGDIILKPTVNELVIVNEIRAFRIQQIDYADRFTVFSTVHNKLTSDDIINQEVSKFLEKYRQYKTIYDKLKLLCEYGLSKEAIEIILGQIPDSDEIKSYYLNLGSDRLKSLGYNITRIRRELGIVTFSPELLVNEIYSNFKEGDKYTLVDLKQKLSNIYSSINYSATPKATDIDNWFQTRVCQMSIIVDNKKKRVNCLELLTSKEQEIRQELKYTN